MSNPTPLCVQSSRLSFRLIKPPSASSMLQVNNNRSCCIAPRSMHRLYTYGGRQPVPASLRRRVHYPCSNSKSGDSLQARVAFSPRYEWFTPLSHVRLDMNTTLCDHQ